MEGFIRGSSSYVRLEVHTGFVVKYRHKVFDDPRFRDRCDKIIREAAGKIGVVIVEMGFERDHVHLDIQMGAAWSLSQVAKVLKGTSGRKLLAEFPAIKRRWFWGSGLWSPALFGDSLGGDREVVRAYIRNQGTSKKPQDDLRTYFTAIPPV